MFRELLVFFVFSLSIFGLENDQKYEWAVVGAGLGGITVVAALLDYEVDPTSIIWIDPEFAMGRMGKYYRNVPSNTQVKNMIRYFKAFKTFKKIPLKSLDFLLKAHPDEHLLLQCAVNPLLEVTDFLRLKVDSIQDMVQSLEKREDDWILITNNQPIVAHKVVLAIGAYPKKLDYQLSEIPLDDALDKDKLSRMISPEDTIAVFGGMHSAMIVLKYLTEIGVKKVINFFTSPYSERQVGIESLEGITKWWVENVLEKNPLQNLMRVTNTPETIDQLLPLCTKAIYAIGFVRNPLPINGNNEYSYDPKMGIIEKNLYGFGIGFPFELTMPSRKKIAINGFNINAIKAHELIPSWVQE